MMKPPECTFDKMEIKPVYLPYAYPPRFLAIIYHVPSGRDPYLYWDCIQQPTIGM